MKRLVVHVGPPKTATTYIQQALYSNAALLAAYGVYLPQTGRLELSPESVCHHHLAWELMGSPRFRQEIGGWGALAAELASIDADTVLVSSELLSPGTLFPRGIGEALQQRLLSIGCPVTVLYVVRDQLSSMNSAYGQEVKLLARVQDFAEHASGALERGDADLERQTARWYESPDVDFVAIPFPALVDVDPLVALLDAARIDVPTERLVTSGEPSNITLGPGAVAAFRLLRHYLEGLNPAVSHDDMAVRQLHRVAARAAKAAGWCEEPFWGWTPESAAEAVAQLAESNERFAQAAWGTPWPLTMPVDRPQAQVSLLDLRGRGLPKVQDFVVAMGKRYIGLLHDDEAASR
ncbi:MAG: hypothetical protein ACR2KG_12175 [Nocardioidaceae bacterium]